MSLLNSIYDRFVTYLAYISCAIYAFLMLALTAHIVGRRFFSYPIPWMVEYGEYLLAISVFLVAAWVLKEEGHVKVDIVLSRLRPRTQAYMNGVTSYILALVLLVFAYLGVLVTQKNFITGAFFMQSYQTPIWVLMVFVPLACLLLSIGFARRGYRNLRLTKKS